MIAFQLCDRLRKRQEYLRMSASTSSRKLARGVLCNVLANAVAGRSPVGENASAFAIARNTASDLKSQPAANRGTPLSATSGVPPTSCCWPRIYYYSRGKGGLTTHWSGGAAASPSNQRGLPAIAPVSQVALPAPPPAAQFDR